MCWAKEALDAKPLQLCHQTSQQLEPSDRTLAGLFYYQSAAVYVQVFSGRARIAGECMNYKLEKAKKQRTKKAKKNKTKKRKDSV